jgi:hypothetical protein
VIPTTSQRVPLHTKDEYNQRIQREMEERVARYWNASPEAIRRRLEELEHEWDIERTLEANAATVSLLGVALGATVSRKWFLLPGLVAGFLLQHAVQGWCPPLSLFRRFGVRTQREIDAERDALMRIRSDALEDAFSHD